MGCFFRWCFQWTSWTWCIGREQQTFAWYHSLLQSAGFSVYRYGENDEKSGCFEEAKDGTTFKKKSFGVATSGSIVLGVIMETTNPSHTTIPAPIFWCRHLPKATFEQGRKFVVVDEFRRPQREFIDCTSTVLETMAVKTEASLSTFHLVILWYRHSPLRTLRWWRERVFQFLSLAERPGGIPSLELQPLVYCTWGISKEGYTLHCNIPVTRNSGFLYFGTFQINKDGMSDEIVVIERTEWKDLV